MPLSQLQRQLQRNNNKKIQLKINDNRSTMLSVRWDPDCTYISLHRLFLDAPKNIMQDLACYVNNEGKDISTNVKAFIEDRLKTFDYSHELDLTKLQTKGAVFNLQRIYNNLNQVYFKKKLNLHITWFGNYEQKNRSKFTFGLYYDPLKLIKINRFLDSFAIPDYLISYVIYHEMLHYVCPSYYDAQGNHHVHSKEFKEREKQFEHYEIAQNWIDNHKDYLFKV